MTNFTVNLEQPAWAARRWDTWSVVIPFDQLPQGGQKFFDLPPGQHLGVWIRILSSSCASPIYTFDAAMDPGAAPGMQYGTEYTGPNGPTQSLGLAPILGLIRGEPISAIPQLEAYGFPQIGGTMLLQVRQAGAHVNGVNKQVTLVMGWSNPNLPVPLCKVLTSADIGSLGPLTASPMGDVAFRLPLPFDFSLLHQHVYLQAAMEGSTQGSLLLTNGVRLTVGGNVP